MDPGGGGFRCDERDARHGGWYHDTSVPGNGNGGHEIATDLPGADKARLLAYLKTL